MGILANNLRMLRKELKLSQTEVAEKLGLGYYTLGKWEQGRAEPSADDLVRLADFFKVSTDFLLGRVDDTDNIVPSLPANGTDIGRNILLRFRDIRLGRKLSQKTVAEALQISQQTYSDYEHGKTNPDLLTLSKIADFFKVSVDYLLGRADGFCNVAHPIPREQQLVTDFRSLTPELQEILLVTVEAWKDAGKRA